jgi:HlyD family secretion protein
MKKNTKSKIITWSIVGVVLLGIAAVIVVNNINTRKAAAATMQTQVLEKGDLTAIVGATGTVRANQSATLVWQANGRIESINAAIGDKVKTDEVLASLAQSSLSQSIILAQSDLVTAQRNLDDLVNSDTARAQAQLTLANAQQEYDKVRWNAVYAGTPRETSQNTLDSASAAVVIAQDRADNAQKEYNKYGESSETDLLKANALANLAAANKALAEAKLSLDFYTNTPDSKEVSISSGEIAVAKAKLDDAQREWDRLKDGPDPADIAAAKARVAAIEATLNMAKISSPFAGVVTNASGMVGDVVSPSTFAYRVDDLSQMFVDVEIPEVDINRVKVDQDVTLTFDAINAAEYQGRVSEVARIGANSAGAVNFKVTIKVLNPDNLVMPGMTAAVNVVVSDLKDVLTVPNRAVRLVEGKRVVYVLKNGAAVKVEIEIGSSSDTLSEIISGDLKVGDVLILNPSADFSSMMSGGRPF